jgi:2-polyprenyl-3-methyl-5-hydroxy-6-metoxy-1,4-benzoquinol methylase
VVLSSPSTSSQLSNAAAYADKAHFVPALGKPEVDLLRPQSDERILDLGCGDGALTEKLVALGAQELGIDNSPDLIAAALRPALTRG